MNGMYSHDDTDMHSYVFARRGGSKRIKGIISSYISCLSAGYIDGEDGVRYFVQGSELNLGGAPATVGTHVTFSPMGEEGRRLRAIEVRTCQKESGVRNDED